MDLLPALIEHNADLCRVGYLIDGDRLVSHALAALEAGQEVCPRGYVAAGELDLDRIHASSRILAPASAAGVGAVVGNQVHVAQHGESGSPDGHGELCLDLSAGGVANGIRDLEF